jgi:hypothetical protein
MMVVTKGWTMKFNLFGYTIEIRKNNGDLIKEPIIKPGASKRHDVTCWCCKQEYIVWSYAIVDENRFLCGKCSENPPENIQQLFESLPAND